MNFDIILHVFGFFENNYKYLLYIQIKLIFPVHNPYLYLHIYLPGILVGVAIMLSITIFATIVGDMLPVSDSTPLIG